MMFPWYLWVVLGIVFFTLEIVTPGFLFACFGVSCLSAGIVSSLGAGIELQILSFTLMTLVTFFGIRPFMLRYLSSSESNVPTNVDALIGKKALVVETIDPLRNKGRVVVGGENWKAISLNDAIIETDTEVVVVKVDGIKLVVRPEIKQ